MSLATKILTTTALGAGAIAGWAYVRNVQRASAELEVVPTASIHQLSWDGLTIRLDVLLKNPTKGSFSIKAPFVKLLYKETVIGSSAALDKEFTIPANGQVLIDRMMIQVPMTNIFSLGFTLAKTLISGGTVVLTIRTVTTIKLALVSLPYETKQEVTLKK